MPYSLTPRVRCARFVVREFEFDPAQADAEEKERNALKAELQGKFVRLFPLLPTSSCAESPVCVCVISTQCVCLLPTPRECVCVCICLCVCVCAYMYVHVCM